MSQQKKTDPIFNAKNNRLFYYAHNLDQTLKKHAVASTLLALFLGLLPVILTFLTKQPLYLLIFPVVTISCWYGNMNAGLLSLAISVLGIGFLNFSLPSLMLTWGGNLLLIYTIDLSKKTREIEKYKIREKKYTDLVLSLEKEYKKAQQEIRARDEFLSLATHELRTPLTAMLLQLQMVLHNIKSVSLANFSVKNLLEMITGAEEQSKRLAQMITDLLNVSLITTGRLNLTRGKFELVETVKNLLKRSSEEIKRQGYVVNLEAPEPIEVVWDKIRTEQALTNLLTNALKYGNSKPITIVLKQKNSHAQIIFRDQGIGISSENQKKIFERFERGVNGDEYKGLGVGLYITQQIVKAHGGKIWVESALGKGSTFTVELPLK